MITLEQSLAYVEELEERYAEADILRVKGDLLLLSHDGDDRAEECYHQYLDIARSQSAKSWKPRTALKLARLWQKQGKDAEARELLTGIYGRPAELILVRMGVSNDSWPIDAINTTNPCFRPSSTLSHLPVH